MLIPLQGKGDGVAINTSGLTDNWDDPEGRYCKSTMSWLGLLFIWEVDSCCGMF